MSITYSRGDERPAWECRVIINGVADDLSAGYTFRAVVASGGEAVVTKTDYIVGHPDGEVQVQWQPNELDIDEGAYTVQLTAKRTSDNHEWTVTEDLIIRPRYS